MRLIGLKFTENVRNFGCNRFPDTVDETYINDIGRSPLFSAKNDLSRYVFAMPTSNAALANFHNVHL